MLELVKTYKNKRYGKMNVNASSEMYIEIGAKLCTKGKHLRISIDSI